MFNKLVLVVPSNVSISRDLKGYQSVFSIII